MISIKKNKTIQLDIPSFSCDKNIVGEHMEKHDVLKHMNSYAFNVVIGKPASGKTSLAISLITQRKPSIFRKCFHHVLIVMPQNSINSMNKNPFQKLPKENFYNELDNESITDIYNRLDGYSKDDEKSLLFIDDQTASLKGSKHIMETLSRIIFNRRHLKTNIILTAQVYNSLPLSIRKCISNLIMFKPSKKEMENVFEELIQSKKNLFDKIMNVCYDKPHNFMFVNMDSQRIYKNWDEILINDDE